MFPLLGYQSHWENISVYMCCELMTWSYAHLAQRVMMMMMMMTGLLIFRGKKSKISRDFQGQIRGKIGQFRVIFAGKKSKFAEKSADFAGFSREKVKICGKIG